MSKMNQNLDWVSGLLKLCDFKSGLNLKIASLLWLLNSNPRNLLLFLIEIRLNSFQIKAKSGTESQSADGGGRARPRAGPALPV